MDTKPTEASTSVSQKTDPMELCELRMRDLHYVQNTLAARAEILSRQSTRFRYALILLGASVAVKGIVDQLMLTYKAPSNIRMILDILFTVVGLSISVVAWRQDAFNPTWKATGLRELAIKASGYSREFMSTVHLVGYNKPEALQDVINRMNGCLNELYTGAAAYGINLSYGSEVDYSDVSRRRS